MAAESTKRKPHKPPENGSDFGASLQNCAKPSMPLAQIDRFNGGRIRITGVLRKNRTRRAYFEIRNHESFQNHNGRRFQMLSNIPVPDETTETELAIPVVRRGARQIAVGGAHRVGHFW